MKPTFKHHILENKFWYIAVVGMLILTVVLGSFALNLEEEKDTYLKVDEVFFVFESIDENSMDLKIIVFLTNDGTSDIEDVKIRAFVIETNSNLARDEDTIVMGKVSGSSTKEGELHVSIPTNDTYRIEIIVFEESKLTIRGAGSINLEGVGVAQDYQNVNDDDLGSVEEDAASFAGGSCSFIVCLGVLGSFVVIIVIVYIVQQVKKDSDPSQRTESFFETDDEETVSDPRSNEEEITTEIEEVD